LATPLSREILKVLKVRSSSLILLLIIGLACVFAGAQVLKKDNYVELQELTVQKVLIALGDSTPHHFVSQTHPQLVQAGYDLVHNGTMSRESGGTGRKISRYFACTDCHNTVREHADIAADDPEDRLVYCMEHGISYKPASTFWGITNRTQWYTKDYVKKYGDLARSARDTLANAVSLCAIECSSGRPLNDAELQAIIHYLHSLQLRIKDLDLGALLLKDIAIALEAKGHELNKKVLIQQIKNAYNQACQATFVDPLPMEKRTFGKTGDPQKGKFIYEQGCMHCHLPNRVTHFEILNDQVSKRFFAKKMKGTSEYSIYDIIRQGTHPILGRRQYMPFYTKEKMSNQQIEDLAAFITQLQ